MTNTDTVKPAKKRGDGPIVVSFLDAAGAEHKRVPKDVAFIQFKPKSGDAVKFDVNQINAAAVLGYAVMGLSGQAKTYVLNHVDMKGDGSDAIPLVNDVLANAVAGNIYSKAEKAEKVKGTGKRGKPYDYEIIAKAWQQARAGMAQGGFKNKLTGEPIQPMGDAEYQDWLMKFKLLPKDSVKDENGKIVKGKMGRDDTVAALKENTFFVKALATLKAAAVKVDKSNNEVDMPDF